MRCYVYPAKKKRTVSTSLLRKIPSLLIGVFGLTCRPVPPRATQPGYLPVRRLPKLLHQSLQIQCSGSLFLFLLWGTNRTQVGICVEGTLKLLGVDLAVLVQNVRIHAGNHVDLCVSRIALSGFQVAVVQFQFVGGTGMTEGIPHF